MFYQPDKFFYVLMLPAFFLIVVPLLWSFFVMLYKGYGRSRLADVRGFVEIENNEHVGTGQKERRKNVRIRIVGSKAIISNKTCCCKSTVANISDKGICLSNIPDKIFKDRDGIFDVTFRSRKRDYQMQVEKKWVGSVENKSMVGAEIISAPKDWSNYVNKFLSKT